MSKNKLFLARLSNVCDIFIFLIMSEFNLISLYELLKSDVEHQILEAGVQLLQRFKLIPQEGQYLCPRGHAMKIVKKN